jgi:hypothetical protein
MKTTVFALAVAALAGSAMAQFSANYGNFAGTNVTFVNVNESTITDSTALYGQPQVVGNALAFRAMTFGVTAANGASDLSDGRLSTIIQSNGGFAISQFQIAETGDYRFVGNGTSATTASVSLAVFISVLDVNGVALSAPLSFSGNGIFTPSNGTFDLVNDPTTNGNVIWAGSGVFNIAAFLASNGITGDATRVSVVLDNTLSATSEQGTIAFIKKKEFDGVAIVVPTPGAAALLGLGALAAGRRRR